MCETKTCSKCGQEKPLDDFSFQKRGRFGRKAACKACMNAILRSKRSEGLYKASPEKAAASAREWAKKNREKRNALSRAYYQRNKKKHIARTSQRPKRVKRATPPWADMQAIRSIYETCPPGYEVDHIIPLKGANVCGLHVPWNLQHLPIEENRRKSNHVLELPT